MNKNRKTKDEQKTKKKWQQMEMLLNLKLNNQEIFRLLKCLLLYQVIDFSLNA
jgi:hypothetical protein